MTDTDETCTPARIRVYVIEAPLREEAKAGMDARERLGRCVEVTRRLLDEVERKKS